MCASRSRTIVATALPGEAEALCAMLSDLGCSETVCVSDGLSAVAQAQRLQTDWIVADAVLPALDGASIEERLWKLPLMVYPGVVLLTLPGMCPRGVGCAIQKPVNRDKLRRAQEMCAPLRRRAPEQKRERAEQALDSIGIPDHCGKKYLLRAIEMAYLDVRMLKSLTTKLYPAVAAEFGTDGRRVERAMRHVIDVAWRSSELEAQYELFGDTIDARRGSPTCGEMIAQIADILRWEGRA